MASKRDPKEPFLEDESEQKRLFYAEMEYSECIFCSAIGDIDSSLAALERSLEIKPDYAPALLTMGSIEYQRGKKKKAEKLYRQLFSLPDDEETLWEIFDDAGDVLIEHEQYALGIELMEAAISRFPNKSNLYINLAICASGEKLYEKALESARKAAQLEPDHQPTINSLGWSLYEAGRLEEAEKVLLKATEMNSKDHCARNNLRICREALSKR